MTNTIIFAHRGLPVKFAENSLEGFRYAVTHGAEGVEFDVHLTKDKVPVVMHDEKSIARLMEQAILRITR